MCSILAPVSAVSISDENEKPLISEMTDEACIAFLKKEGVVIPYDEENVLRWGPIIKRMVIAIENNPNHIFSYNFTLMQQLANDVKTVVNDYYEAEINMDAVETASTLATGLQDSTLVAAWTAADLAWNCYGYSIGQINYVNPGYFSDNQMTEMLSLSEIADLVVADLIALGKSYVQTTTLSNIHELCTNEKMIALRISPDEDYHFMKIQNGSWYHKPGNTAVLKYKYDLSLVRLWTNESIFQGVYYPATIEYDSSIILITYGGAHDWEYEYCGSGQHIKTCTICDKTSGAAKNCVYLNGSANCAYCYQPKSSSISIDIEEQQG